MHNNTDIIVIFTFDFGANKIMRNYIKTSECPRPLWRIIDAVNHLPVNADEILEKLIDLDSAAIDSVLYREEIKKLNLEDAVLFYLIGEMPTHISTGDVAQNFSELLLAKPVLQNIAEINRDEMEKHGKQAFTENKINPLAKPYIFRKKMRGIRFSGTLDLDGKGNIRPSVSGLSAVFTEKDIPPERIRSCPVCSQITWAARLDAKTCGRKNCAETFSKSNITDEKKQEINANRRVNYRRNKKLKEIRSKNNVIV